MITKRISLGSVSVRSVRQVVYYSLYLNWTQAAIKPNTGKTIDGIAPTSRNMSPSTTVLI